MKHVAYLFIGLAALLASGNAYAAKWKVVYSDENRVIHVDESSISKGWLSGVREATFTTHFFEEQMPKTRQAYNITTMRWYFRCSEHQFALKSDEQRHRGVDGNRLVWSHVYDPTDADYTDVHPGSIGEVMLKAACGRK